LTRDRFASNGKLSPAWLWITRRDQEKNGFSVSARRPLRFAHASRSGFPATHQKKHAEVQKADRVSNCWQRHGRRLRKMPAIIGGMQKRVGLGRALAFGAGYLLLDEPTAASTPSAQRRSTIWFGSSSRNITWHPIVVTHDLHQRQDDCEPSGCSTGENRNRR